MLPVLIVGILGGVTISRLISSDPQRLGPAEAPDLRAELARISQRLDAVEQASRATAGGSPGMGSGASLHLPPRLEQRPDSAATRAHSDRSIAALARQFQTLPPSDPATQRMGQSIEQLLGPGATAAGVPKPLATRTECRAGMCQVSATYRDETQADEAGTMLPLNVEAGLARTRTFLRPRSDGTQELVMFMANAAGVASLKAGDH